MTEAARERQRQAWVPFRRGMVPPQCGARVRCTCHRRCNRNGMVNLLRLRLTSDEQAAHFGSIYAFGSPLRACNLSPTFDSFPHLL